MPPTSSHVPLPGRSPLRAPGPLYRPPFSPAIRWVLAVLAWVAFGVAGYLALKAVTGSSVAGCGVGAANGCDVVLSSSWSKWLGIPVAVLGLACYASLASLAVVLGWRNPAANRWITTVFVLLSLVAAGASIWFIGVQVFAIGRYCRYCLVTDVCGIALGVIALLAAFKAGLARPDSSISGKLLPGVLSLRPTARAGASAAATSVAAPPPSLVVAVGGAVPLVVVLIGGQVLFASKTFQVEKIALNQNVSLDSPGDAPPTADGSKATTRVAMRVPSETDAAPATDAGDSNDPAPAPSGKNDTLPSASTKNPPPANGATGDSATAGPAEPAKQRLITFLGGKLTLDVYRHPVIGSPDAPHIVVEMVSYDCPHCRKMSPIIHEAVERYGDEVALLIMPIPLDRDCNSLVTDPTLHHPGACGTTRLVLGLARLNPAVFGKFHDFLMTGEEKPPDMSRIIPKAYELANPDKLREVSRGPEVQKQMEGYVKLFGKLLDQNKGAKSFGLPVQILGDKVMSGAVEKPEDVFKAWEENLGVKPK